MAHLLNSPKANRRARTRKSLGSRLKSLKSRRQGVFLDVLFLPVPKSPQEAVSGAKNLPNRHFLFFCRNVRPGKNSKTSKNPSCGNSPLESPISWRPILIRRRRQVLMAQAPDLAYGRKNYMTAAADAVLCLSFPPSSVLWPRSPFPPSSVLCLRFCPPFGVLNTMGA